MGETVQPQNTENQVTRLPTGRWAPGRSPNPGGRPKVAGAVRELARQHTQLAVETLVEICEHGQSEAARIATAVALLDRAWGKPMVAVEVQDAGPDLGALILEAHRRATELLAAPMAIEETSLDDDAG
jgi:hypothetical protein